MYQTCLKPTRHIIYAHADNYRKRELPIYPIKGTKLCWDHSQHPDFTKRYLREVCCNRRNIRRTNCM